MLSFNPIMVDNHALFFNCTPVCRASDSMMARLKAIHFSLLGRSLLSVAWPTGVQLVFFFCSGVSKLFGAQGSPSSGSLLKLLSSFFIYQDVNHDLSVCFDDSKLVIDSPRGPKS